MVTYGDMVTYPQLHSRELAVLAEGSAARGTW